MQRLEKKSTKNVLIFDSSSSHSSPAPKARLPRREERGRLDLVSDMRGYGKRPRQEGEEYDDDEGERPRGGGEPSSTAAVVEAALAEEKAAKLAKGGARSTVLPTKAVGGKASQFVVEGEDDGATEDGPIKEVSERRLGRSSRLHVVAARRVRSWLVRFFFRLDFRRAPSFLTAPFFFLSLSFDRYCRNWWARRSSSVSSCGQRLRPTVSTPLVTFVYVAFSRTFACDVELDPKAASTFRTLSQRSIFRPRTENQQQRRSRDDHTAND